MSSSDPLADDMNNMSPAAASVFSSPPLSSSANLIPATSTGQGSSYLSRAFNSNVTVVMAIVLFALVVVAFINTVARCRTVMHRGIWTRQQESQGVAGTTVLESAQQQQPWQLQHKGLQKVQIESFPVFTYGAATASTSKLQNDIECCGGGGEGGGLVIGTSRDDCAVCLSEYQNGEQVRLLPLCRHSFHLHCIDTWLSTHETCPVCRHSVLDHPHDHYPQSSMITDPAAAEAPDSSAAAAGSSLQDDGTAVAASASTAEHTATRGAISGGFGSNILFNFGSARFGGSARISSTSDQIEPVVDLEDLHVGTPGSWTNDDQDVAAAAAAAAAGRGSASNSYHSSSAAASRWSFSAFLLRNPDATTSG
ncbi:unnamed protein product [Sphagnum compactum]